MGFKANENVTLTVKAGDRFSSFIGLYDRPAFGKGNGIHVQASSTGDIEGWIAGLEPNLDAVVVGHSSNLGKFYDEAKPVPNDTRNDQKTAVYKVAFQETTDKANIVVERALLTKTEEIGGVIAGMTFKKADGTALTVKSVGYTSEITVGA